jgi:hypothetical protein
VQLASTDLERRVGSQLKALLVGIP